MLSTKLAAPPPARPSEAVSKPIVPPGNSKLERFEEELMRAMQNRPNSADHRKQCILDVKARAEFKALTYQEIDKVRERIDRLWPVASGQTKR